MKKLVGDLKNKKGFTLAEIMIVILVIAVLVAVLVPALGTAVRKAQVSAALQNGKRAYEAAQIIATEEYIAEGNAVIEIDPEDVNTFIGKAGFFTDTNLVAKSDVSGGEFEGGTITEFTYTHADDIIIVLDDNGEISLSDEGATPTPPTPPAGG